MKDEKRVTERFKTGYNYKAKLILLSDFTVKDISMSGIGMITSLPLKINDTYRIELASPEKEKMQFSCEVVNCFLKGTQKEKDNLVPLYEAGLKFLELTDEGKHFLEQIIKKSSPGDKRRSKRINKGIEITLITADIVIHAGTTDNLSRDGICIWTYKDYPPGTQVKLEIYPSSKEKISVRGNVKWIDKTQFHEKGIHMGIELIGSRPNIEFLKFLETLE